MWSWFPSAALLYCLDTERTGRGAVGGEALCIFLFKLLSSSCQKKKKKCCSAQQHTKLQVKLIHWYNKLWVRATLRGLVRAPMEDDHLKPHNERHAVLWIISISLLPSDWWMTDVTKLLDTAVREIHLCHWTAYFQSRQEGIIQQIEDKGKPVSSLSMD